MKHVKLEERIVKIELTPIHVPFKEYVAKALEETQGGLGMAIPSEDEWLGGDFVICKLITNEGTMGLGDAFVWLPESGISPEQIIHSISKGLSKYILGESPFNTERISRRMDSNVTRNEIPKGILDMACYDLMGKITSQPAHAFMGGKCIDEIPLTALIPLADPLMMKGITRSFLKKGFKTFRIKLGKGIQEDYEIAKIIREYIGPQIRLRTDYNQAYNPTMAVKAINKIEQFEIDVAEQPVRANDYAGMVYVQKKVKTPLMAHEGQFSLQDIVSLVKMKAIEVIGINTERPGGVTNAIKALNFAERLDLGVVLHNQPLGISSAMTIHLAAARFHSLGHAIELFGHEMIEDDLIIKPLNYEGGTAKIPEGNGWGVELDENALEKYATGETIELKI